MTKYLSWCSDCAARVLFHVGIALCVSFHWACQSTSQEFQTSLVSPSDIELAGAEGQWLLVADAGGDSVQVLSVGESLVELDFLASPARFFPLRVLAGPAPEDLLATPDGRFVMVLNPLVRAVSVVDTSGVQPVGWNGPTSQGGDDLEETTVSPFSSLYFFNLELFGESPTTFSQTMDGCEDAAGCEGRFWIGFGGGEVLEAEFAESSGIKVVKSWNFDGAVTSIVLGRGASADGLFVSHGTSISKIDLGTGATRSADVASVARTLSLTAGGDIVAVSRPTQEDLVFLDAISLLPISANTLSSTVACVAPCDQTEACGTQTFVEAAQCSDGVGGLQTGVPYEGLWSGHETVSLIPLGEELGHASVQGRSCADSSISTDAESQSFSSSMLAVQRDGSIRWVEFGGAAGPAWVRNEDWCEQPTLTLSGPEGVSDLSALLSEVFETCPSLPDDRFVCMCDDDCDWGVGIVQGQIQNLHLSLDWEGILLNRAQGGGSLESELRFMDVRENDLLEQPIEVGDWLQILTEPDATCELSGTDLCQRDRRIVDIDSATGALVLDAPLPLDCYSEANTLAYQVRAGDAFLVQTQSGQRYRVRTGAAFGPGSAAEDFGGANGLSEPWLLRMKSFPDLGTSACERLSAPEPFVRDSEERTSIRIDIEDPYEVAVSGQNVGERLSVFSGFAGSLPGRARLFDRGAEGPMVVLSYGGASGSGGALLAFSPFDLSNLPMNESIGRLGDYASNRYRVIE